MSDSEYDSDDNKELTEKEKQEIERRRKKNQKKKQSKKNRKKDEPVILSSNTPVAAAAEENGAAQENGAVQNGSAEKKDSDEVEIKIEVEYVSEDPLVDQENPAYEEFSKVFNTFRIKTEAEIKKEQEEYQYRKESGRNLDPEGKAALTERILQEEMEEKRREREEAGEQQLSRKKIRLNMQPSIAALKAKTQRPDVVEWADVTSRDPHLLVELKSYRNTVPVPRHWNAKRKYLAGKRGFERQPFELPEYIKRTGIMEMRETMWEKEDHQTLKSKMRDRMRPKLGRIDIDYQKLHDAFFKWQTKPFMTTMGELYYEGKELEAQMKEKKPGQLSDELRIALGMPIGPTANKFPPPWLIAMQRYGPPPSYPNLKVAGLNCPIPEGCSFGYHAGGWGKPPVDEMGKPLYGDVFGLEIPHVAEVEDESQIDRRHWGEIGSEEEESDEESEDEEEDTGAAQPQNGADGFATPAPTEAGTATPSGITTIPGVETPDIVLRKRGAAEESLAGVETPVAPAAAATAAAGGVNGELYQIIPEKKVERLSSKDILASTHVYDLSKKSQPRGDTIEVSLNPEELDLSDQKGLEEKYEEQLRKQTRDRQAVEPEEDFSDMIAEHAAKQTRKRKAQESKAGGGGGGQKKHKEFKF